ncbi:GalNAc(5)-diNAcBac-PP-undecaprenol beta-1,3-glucosyltransferase [Polaromonas vacuolata]|uniref:GalNAc(5)-diNAcBac-PP-undecaprenol beta-1,3-glucosyltransferase n=1 Tax=Polaromonas vacuolata TaxID=37448 RepID=A0A6H2H7E0_9BURK|nr:glycosyltransferase [Polaromonas vacuolata]QJC55778.1 GalNAc(5)-diNAcBac-PP-undecaprenol beta-1,3-glucosyltransferase [Polaromonas vacuolata]
MDNQRPLISILTPTWNRVNYLDRVWEGLNSQTYKHIEWIVSDDGSTDGTDVKLAELCAKSMFPVTLIKASVHIGKARMDNEAIAQARGEFIVWNDSDDYFLPQAIESLVKAWNSIPEYDRKNYAGITALCADWRGVISTALPKEGIFDITWNDLREKFKVDGDMLYFSRADLIKKYKFPEVDFLVPEGFIWTSIGKSKKVRLLPVALMMKEYGAVNAISFSGKMKYSRGRAHALAESVRNLKSYPKALFVKFWRVTTFVRYCVHGDLRAAEAVELWNKNTSKFVLFSVLPIAFLLVIKDLLQRKVHKTHVEFEKAKKTCRISIFKTDK